MPLKAYRVLRFDPAGGEKRDLESFLNDEIQPYQQIASVFWDGHTLKIVLEARD